jgi:hypothetical protein
MTTDIRPSAVSDRSINLLVAAALLAIALGFAVQGGLILFRLSTGLTAPAIKMTADALSGVAWSAIVCSGIAIGMGATRYRARLMGLLGLICAPLGFALAKGVQKGVAVLSGTPAAPIDTLVLQIGGLKTIEYALLGVTLAWLLRSKRSTLGNHALTGLVFGLVFGGGILGLEMAAGVVPATKLLGLVFNEVLFPIGCASVLYLVDRLASAGARA